MAVDDPVESLPVRADVQRVHLVPALLAQRLPHLVDRRRIHDRGERLTQDVFDAQREMIADVLADLRDGQRRLGQHQQHAIGLDRPRDVDGLAVTVGQVDHGVPPLRRVRSPRSSLLLHPSRERQKSRARRGDDLLASRASARQAFEPGEHEASTSPGSPPRRR